MNKEFKHTRKEADKIFKKPTSYRSYVGPKDQYDFMGATQFALLWELGLRAKDKLLDVGCGSLRSGKLFIPYLDKGNYFGIEPNHWLIEDAIENELGKDIIKLKEPSFDANNDFDCSIFNTKFDFIVAQSIFSHCGPDLIETALMNLSDCIREDGLIVATFVTVSDIYKEVYETGWVYPKCYQYTETTLKKIFQATDLSYQKIPWFHPRQAWYLFSKRQDRLPNENLVRHLHGMVLSDDFILSQREVNAEVNHLRIKLEELEEQQNRLIKSRSWRFAMIFKRIADYLRNII